MARLAAKPGVRPANPNFASGPCAKRPGFTLDALKGAYFGRSHRAAAPKARLAEVIERSRAILGMPPDWRLGIVPASDTGAVEMALWDVLGKAVRQPLYRLLGGAVRRKVELAACMGIRPYEEAKAIARQYVEMGFSTLKTKAGRDAAEDLEMVRGIRGLHVVKMDGRDYFEVDGNALLVAASVATPGRRASVRRQRHQSARPRPTSSKPC